jgi:hypothetical protein
MDALTASIIVAVIAAIAAVAVALLTARARIGALPAKAAGHSSSLSDGSAGLSESAKKFRVLGWLLVVVLYLAASFCVLQGLNALHVAHHWDRWEAIFGSELADRAELGLYFRFWIAIGVALILTGYWAQRRLRCRSAQQQEM